MAEPRVTEPKLTQPDLTGPELTGPDRTEPELGVANRHSVEHGVVEQRPVWRRLLAEYVGTALLVTAVGNAKSNATKPSPAASRHC